MAKRGAGVLRHQVTLQSQSTAQNSYGEAVRTWADLGTVWAQVSPVSARELFAAAQAQATTTHQITIRYRSDVTASCRVKFGSRYFAIDGVLNPDERNWRLVLLCTEGASDDGA